MAQSESKSSMLVSSAILLRKAGYDHKAIDVLQLAIKEDPKNAQAYVLLGALSQAINNNELAENYFREALLLEPINSDALQGLGLFLVSQHRYAEALPYIEKHRIEDPNNLLSLDGLIESYSKLPDKKDELQEILQQIWENTENPDIGYRYARYLLDIGNREKAQGVISSFIETSSDPNSLAELARVFNKKEDFESAVKLLLKAVKLDPQFERGWRDLARSYDRIEENEKALEAIERAIAIDSTKPENWTTKSFILFGMKAHERFLKSSSTAIDLFQSLEKEDKSGDLFLLRLFRTITQTALNNQDQVLLESKLGQEEFPNTEIFYIIPVDYLLMRKQPEEALKILRSAPTNKLKNLLRPNKYEVLHQMNRSKEAWKCIEPYLRKASEEDFGKLVDVGSRFYYRGMTKPALSVYQQFKDFKPGDLRVANNLGYILIGEGDYLNAFEILKDVAHIPLSDCFKFLAMCNLAYIYNMKGDYRSALSEIEDVMNSDFTQEVAKLRVTFWIDGTIISDPSSIPGRNLSIGECALSCAVSSAIALGDLELASNYVKKLLEISNNKTLEDMVVGSLELSKDEPESAKHHWTKALNSTELKSDQKAIETWLKTIS